VECKYNCDTLNENSIFLRQQLTRQPSFTSLFESSLYLLWQIVQIFEKKTNKISQNHEKYHCETFRKAWKYKFRTHKYHILINWTSLKEENLFKPLARLQGEQHFIKKSFMSSSYHMSNTEKKYRNMSLIFIDENWFLYK
jgi:hypothetical protein